MVWKKMARLPTLSVLVAACLVVAFTAASVSAQEVCEPYNRCDRDGDGLPKHLKGHCSVCSGPVDCDDSIYDPENNCDGGTSEPFNVQLAGAFEFSSGIVQATPNSRGNILSSEEDAEMLRPDGDLGGTWDGAFEATCPNFFAAGPVEIGAILSRADKWIIEQAGEVRVILQDVRLTDASGTAWDVTVQLIGDGTSGDPLLPEPGPTSEFNLHEFGMWGREVKGGPGGRSSCVDGGGWLRDALDPPDILWIWR